MSTKYERKIMDALSELRRFESRLQTSFEGLAHADLGARASFLYSLGEWNARAQRLEGLLDEQDAA